ncbi:MAG: AI-2 transport protein TqsA [Saprospiraceae bacterium]|jgi:AI-2 transport protein TqsA
MKIERLSHTLIVIALILLFIIYSKDFLVPVILAIVLWYLINAVNSLVRMITKFSSKVPNGITLGLSTIFVLFIIFSVGSVIGQTINSMISAAPDYKVNLEQQLSRIMAVVGYTETISLSTMTSELDMNGYLGSILNSFKNMAQQFLLILLYTFFLLIEQHTFTRKMAALRFDKERKERIATLTTNINKAVRTYIGVKFAASFATGLLSYGVIKFAGLDFALFWAFLIFVFNFIPTIGSIVATIFPSIIALLQFDQLSPFFIILIGVGFIQLCIGGILEPKLYGDSLNISPFVIVISLVLWGLLWGIVGMLLCVPIIVIMINVFAQFPKTRSVAVLLSQNGKV